MAQTRTAPLSVPYVTPGETYAASILLPCLGIGFVVLRFYTRKLQKMSYSIDDWLMLPALVCLPDHPSGSAVNNWNYGYRPWLSEQVLCSL